MIPETIPTIGLIACLAMLAAVVLSPCLKAFRRLGWAALAVGMIFYGGGKSRFAFDGGIKASTPTYSTNDEVVVTWQRDTSAGVYVPDAASVYIDYRPNAETNAEWVALAQTTVGAWSWTGSVQDATNYDYNVWAYYIPPEPVHTNGVWVYKTLKDRSGTYPIPLRARIEVNGKAISTPKEKRKDEE